MRMMLNVDITNGDGVTTLDDATCCPREQFHHFRHLVDDPANVAIREAMTRLSRDGKSGSGRALAGPGDALVVKCNAVDDIDNSENISPTPPELRTSTSTLHGKIDSTQLSIAEPRIPLKSFQTIKLTRRDFAQVLCDLFVESFLEMGTKMITVTLRDAALDKSTSDEEWLSDAYDSDVDESGFLQRNYQHQQKFESLKLDNGNCYIDDDLRGLGWLCSNKPLMPLPLDDIENPVNKTQSLNYSPTDKDVKPPFSFSLLIFMAIEQSQYKMLRVKDIYDWIVNQFPYFKFASTGWRNSVRHNLSLNKCFKKVPRERIPAIFVGSESDGKGSLWETDEVYRNNLVSALKRTCNVLSGETRGTGLVTKLNPYNITQNAQLDVNAIPDNVDIVSALMIIKQAGCLPSTPRKGDGVKEKENVDGKGSKRPNSRNAFDHSYSYVPNYDDDGSEYTSDGEGGGIKKRKDKKKGKLRKARRKQRKQGVIEEGVFETADDSFMDEGSEDDDDDDDGDFIGGSHSAVTMNKQTSSAAEASSHFDEMLGKMSPSKTSKRTGGGKLRSPAALVSEIGALAAAAAKAERKTLHKSKRQTMAAAKATTEARTASAMSDRSELSKTTSAKTGAKRGRKPKNYRDPDRERLEADIQAQLVDVAMLNEEPVDLSTSTAATASALMALRNAVGSGRRKRKVPMRMGGGDDDEQRSRTKKSTSRIDESEAINALLDLKKSK